MHRRAEHFQRVLQHAAHRLHRHALLLARTAGLGGLCAGSLAARARRPRLRLLPRPLRVEPVRVAGADAGRRDSWELLLALPRGHRSGALAARPRRRGEGRRPRRLGLGDRRRRHRRRHCRPGLGGWLLRSPASLGIVVGLLAPAEVIKADRGGAERGGRRRSRQRAPRLGVRRSRHVSRRLALLSFATPRDRAVLRQARGELQRGLRRRRHFVEPGQQRLRLGRKVGRLLLPCRLRRALRLVGAGSWRR